MGEGSLRKLRRQDQVASMWQFSIKRLLVSMAIIAVACGTAQFVFQAFPRVARAGNQRGMSVELAAVLLAIAFVLAGSGVGLLFKRPLIGGALGFGCFIVYLAICIITSMYKW